MSDGDSASAGAVHVDVVFTGADREAAKLDAKMKAIAANIGSKFGDQFAESFGRGLGPKMAKKVSDASREAQRAAKPVKIDVDVELGGAEAHLTEFTNKKRTIGIDVDVNTGGAAAHLGEIEGAARGASGGASNLALALASIGPIALPALSAAAAGVTAIGTAAVAAGAGAGVLALAFHGIGGAIKEATASTSKNAVAVAGAASAQSSLARSLNSVKQAQASLANTIANNRSSMISANEAVASSERDLTRAQQNTREAQLALNDARKEAARILEDYNNKIADGNLAARQDAIDVTRSKEALDRLQFDPSATKADRDQAQLDYDQAIQRQKEQKQENKRTAAEAAKARKAGINGSDQVLAAEKAIKDAKEAERDAERRLADSERARADQARNNAAAQVSAENSVRDAKLSVADAQRNVTKQTSKTKDAFAGLNKEARKFVSNVAGLKPFFTQLREAAQGGKNGIFASLNEAIDKFNKSGFKTTLLKFVGKISDALGGVVRKFTDAFSKNSPFGKAFSTLDKTAPKTISTLGDIGLHVAQIFAGIFTAAQPAGQKLLGDFNKFLKRIDKFVNSPKGQKALSKFFSDAVPNIEKVAKLVGHLFKLAADLTDSKGFGDFIDHLTSLVDRTDKFVKEHPDQVAEGLRGIFYALLAFKAIKFTSNFFKGLAALSKLPKGVFKGAKKAGSVVKNVSGRAVNGKRGEAGERSGDGILRKVGRGAKKGGINFLETFGLRSSKKEPGSGLAFRGDGKVHTITSLPESGGRLSKVGRFGKSALTGKTGLGIGLVAGIGGAALAHGSQKGSVRSIAGNALSGAATGAGIGALAGPAGAVVGGVVGGVAGGLIGLGGKKTKAAFANVVKFAKDFKKNLKKILDDVGHYFKDLYEKHLKGPLDKIGHAFRFLYDHVVKPVWHAIHLWITVNVKLVQVAFGLVKIALILLGRAFKYLYEHVVKPVFQHIKKFISDRWGDVKKVFGYIKDGLVAVGKKFADLYNKYVKPKFQAIYNKVIKPVWDKIRPVFKAIGDYLNDHVVKAFKNAVKNIGKYWGDIKKVVEAPVKFIVNTVINKGIIGTFNKLAESVYGNKDHDITTINYSTGGSNKKPAPGSTSGAGAEHGGRAMGGVLPGFSPGKDIHTFFSKTAGTIHLSGGEAIMRPEFTRAVGGAKGVAELNKRARQGRHFFGGGVVNFGKGAWNKAKNTAESAIGKIGTVAKGLANPKKVFEDLINKLSSKMPNAGSTLAKTLTKVPLKLVKGLVNKVESFVGLGGPGSGASGGGGKINTGGVQQWAPIVSQVLGLLHQPANDLNAVLTRIRIESGGNPNAINLWDSNAKAGHPSQGLMQTIPGTFAAYAGPFKGRGITDPLANIYAGVNYAIHRYGKNWVNIMTRPGGYDSGGIMPPGVGTYHNATGKPEAVLTHGQWNDINKLVENQKNGARGEDRSIHISAEFQNLIPTIKRVQRQQELRDRVARH